MANSSPLLEARELKRSFTVGRRRVEVLRGVSLAVLPGDLAFLVGASGAGKSTLLYTLAGLERPDAGEVIFEGKPLYGQRGREQARVRNQRMGFVFQSYQLLSELTALENVRLPLMIGGSAQTSARERDERAGGLLNELQLGDRLHHLPAELSGGEQQRVAIARALVHDPQIVFADEPTGNLDSKTGSAVMEMLLNLVAGKGKALLVVTHDPALAARGGRRLEMVDGLLAGAPSAAALA